MKKNRLLQVILIAMVIFMVAIPMFNKYYVRPRNFKKELFKKTRGNILYESIKTERIKEYVDCVYENFKAIHGHVDNFSGTSNYGKDDVKILFRCNAEYLSTESEKKYVLDNLDSLVTAYFIHSSQTP